MTTPGGNAARAPWRVATIFLVSFFLLQLAWNQLRGSPLERWVIDQCTVRVNVALINALTSHAQALAAGPRIVAPGGGINVRRGCEGTEILFPLIAALLAYPLRWQVRALGLLGGMLLVFLLNQLRLLLLFYSIRNTPTLFAQLHGLIAPLALIACTLMFYMMLLAFDRHLSVAVRH